MQPLAHTFRWREFLAAFLLVLPASASAAIFSFTPVTHNRAQDMLTGSSQLTVEVTDVGVGANQVKFILSNSGPNASSICDVYFDDGTLLGIAAVIDGPGVDFEVGAKPKQLPGGNNIEWNDLTGRHFSADSEPSTQPNGVNPGESVAIVFDLLDGQDLQDVLAAMAMSLEPDNVGHDVYGGLRIGIHVQGFWNGGSESFVNGPAVTQPVVPEPGTVTFWGIALAMCGATRLRRYRQARAALSSRIA